MKSDAAESTYDLKPAKVPVLCGLALRLMVAALERPWLASLIAPLLARDLGVREWRATVIEEPPTFFPIHPSPWQARSPGTSLEAVSPVARPPAHRHAGTSC
jgi:hypothetical protein